MANEVMVINSYILEKVLLSKMLSMTGTSLWAGKFKCMEIVWFSPSSMLTASARRLIITPVNIHVGLN